jgi:hypothetical protein
MRRSTTWTGRLLTSPAPSPPNTSRGRRCRGLPGCWVRCPTAVGRTPELYRLRGTLEGIRRAVELVFDVTPVIEEPSNCRGGGGVGTSARLGSVRLFGRSRSRFRLGRSALGVAPLRSHGDPDRDPFREAAYRFTVLMPPEASLDAAGERRLEALLDAQKPAHTLYAVRVGGGGFVVGSSSVVGVDSRLAGPDAPVLGSRKAAGSVGNVRLNRMSLLWSGSPGIAGGSRVGGVVVGANTIVLE